MVGEDIRLTDAQLPIQHVEEFALDTSDIALPEDTSAEGPMHVLQGGVVGVLRGDNEGAEENTLEGPLLEGNGEVRAGAGDVDESDKHGGGGHFSAGENGGSEAGEFLHIGVVGGAATSGCRRCGVGTAHGVIYGLSDCVHKII